MDEMRPERCPICDGVELERAFHWESPPEGETRFDLPEGQDYVREFWRCGGCGHYVGSTPLDLDALYEGDYVDATYSGDGIAQAYERIMSLPPEQSDNAGRVERVASFMERSGASRKRTALDVGSGLAVFPARLSELGWRCTALDPDPRAVEHARERVGVETVHADFMKAGDLGTFELITLNKVLEHVGDPGAMLERARRYMDPGSVIYIEVPDGEVASKEGPGRQEFFIEHLHAFSAASLSLLVSAAGLELAEVGRVHEPSQKHTLFAFARKGAMPS